MKFSRPELHADDESSVHSSAVRGNFTSGRRPLGSSSSVLKVPTVKYHSFSLASRGRATAHEEPDGKIYPGLLRHYNFHLGSIN